MTKTYSVEAFCKTYGISRALFYKLLKNNKAPKIMKVGRKTLVSFEAAQEWQKNLEQ